MNIQLKINNMRKLKMFHARPILSTVVIAAATTVAINNAPQWVERIKKIKVECGHCGAKIPQLPKQ